MKFVTLFYIISVLQCSCYASSLRPGHRDHPSASGIHIRVINRVLSRNGGLSCSHCVVDKIFHISLASEDSKVINHDVVTDLQGNAATEFQFDDSKGLPTAARLTLCAAGKGELDKNDSDCSVAQIKSSDIDKLAITRDDKNAFEVVIYVRWCIDSLIGEIIGEDDFNEGRAYNSKISPDARRHGFEPRSGIGASAQVVNMQPPNDRSNLNFDPAKFRRKRAAYSGKSSGSASSFRRPFDMSDPQNFKRTWGDRDEIWVKRGWPAKRIWGDSGEAWLKRNEDKRMWGDSGEAWLKRNDDKRIWGDSGEAWLKRDGINRSPEQELAPEADLMNDGKRAWGDDGMAWVKRSKERR